MMHPDVVEGREKDRDVWCQSVGEGGGAAEWMGCVVSTTIGRFDGRFKRAVPNGRVSGRSARFGSARART